MQDKDRSAFVVHAFPPELEEDLRALADLVTAGAKDLLEDLAEPRSLLEDGALRRRFFCLAHQGFSTAQDRVYERLTADEPCSQAEEAFLRKVMDAVAWQMIQGQLYVARQLYRDNTQPSPRHSSLEVTRQVAQAITSDDSYRFALLSDLTSFVQMGDLLTIDPDKGIGIIEVKSGDTNARILDFVSWFDKNPDPRVLMDFRAAEGEKTYEQLIRISRQSARMRHLRNIATAGDSVDPDSGLRTVVADQPVQVDLWDHKLAEVLSASKERGWAIGEVDDTLYMGAYRERSRVLARQVFDGWMKLIDLDPAYPVTNLIGCMATPLALPLFARQIPADLAMDVLFGRAVVFLSIHIDHLIGLCSECGLQAKWSSRKRAARYRQQFPGNPPWICRNRALLIGAEAGLAPIGDGIFGRILYHGETPRSVLQMLREAPQDNMCNRDDR